MSDEGGTEAFPDLGKHCQHEACLQLDFLPFKCDGCCKVFCLEHRSYKTHECPKADQNNRKVILCQICSTAFHVTGKEEEEEVKKMLEKHEKSKDCDPAKKKKPRCPVSRCKEVLTFSNNSTCNVCKLKVCLSHRFPADHACKGALVGTKVGNNGRGLGNKFLEALVARNGKDCGAVASISTKNSKSANTSKSSRIPSVRAC